MNTENITLKELADFIKLREETVVKLVQSGEIPAIKNGDTWTFHLSAIDPYLQKQLLAASDEMLDQILATKKNLIPMSKLCSPELIDLNTKVDSREKVLSQLAKMAQQHRVTPSYEDLYIALEEREKQASTAMGKGVALPHPRVPSLKLFPRPRIMILISPAGVEFGQDDGEKTHVFMMPCSPTEFTHIRLIAKISKFLHTEGSIERLHFVKNTDEIISMLTEFDREHLHVME